PIASRSSAVNNLHYGTARALTESWCDAILDSVDDHHNSRSGDPGYSILEVYGIPLTNRLQSVLVELGFSAFTSMDYGFCARKL
ncbi:hypothetical protein, partial [Burkholderia cenocepacia]|uniref:hypothetical protein n=1 Tax=Burkholderia cenocepacia TaxID=95486 RepID=UPI002AB7926B